MGLTLKGFAGAGTPPESANGPEARRFASFCPAGESRERERLPEV